MTDTGTSALPSDTEQLECMQATTKLQVRSGKKAFSAKTL
jgi:hypothetical protein